MAVVDLDDKDARALGGAVLGQFRRHRDEPFEFLDWAVAPVASGFNAWSGGPRAATASLRSR